jgi:hypothetical protein
MGKIALAAFAVAIVLGAWLWRRSRKARTARQLAEVEQRQQQAALIATKMAELDRLLPLADNGDEQALGVIKPSANCDHAGKWWDFVREYGDAELVQRFKDAIDNGKAAVFYSKNIATVTSQCGIWLSDADTETRIEAIEALIHLYQNGDYEGRQRLFAALNFTYEQLLEALNLLLTEQRDELLALAEAGDREAFIKAEALVASTWCWEVGDQHRRFYGIGATGLSKPAGWNALVVRYHRSPRLEQFATGGLEWRDYIALSADAVCDKDPVAAQMVIAACEANKWVRTQIGDYRYAELTLIASQAWATQHPAAITEE